MNLAHTWRETELARPGATLAEALRALNQALGARYTSARLYEWLAGSRPVPAPVRDYMLRAVIARVLEQEAHVEALTDEQLDRIAERLR